MNSLFFGLVALLALNAFAVVTYVIWRWPEVGAAVSYAVIVSAWEIPEPPPLASLFGDNVYLQDVISVSFMLIGLISWKRVSHRLGTMVSVAWLLLGACILFSFSVGIVSEPLGKAVNEFRSYAYPFAAFTWAMSLPWRAGQRSRIMERGPLVLGWSLTVVALYHVSQYGLGTTSTFIDTGSDLEQTTRPLISGQALMLLICGIFAIRQWHRSKQRTYLLSSLVFVIGVIASQQRTVWSVALAVMIAVFIRAGSRGKVALIVSAVFGAAASFVLTLTPIGPQLLGQLSDSATDSGTYDGRVNSWLSLISQSFDSGPTAVLIGQPMGFGFGRFEGADRWVDFSPHNWYVSVFLRAGLTGVVLLVALLMVLIVRSLRRLALLAALAVFVVLLFYGWAYSWPWYLCLPWGWAVSEAAKQSSGGRVGASLSADVLDENSKKQGAEF